MTRDGRLNSLTLPPVAMPDWPALQRTHTGSRLMRTMWLCMTLLVFGSGHGLAQTTQELVTDGQNTENIITQSMGYDRKSYSPLNQINRSNLHRLVPIWNASLMNNLGELAAPVIYDGVMYVINGQWTFAIDVTTGRQIWRTPVTLEDGTQLVPHRYAVRWGSLLCHTRCHLGR